MAFFWFISGIFACVLLCNWCHPAKQKGLLKLQEWQILKRVFNIYLTQNKPWDRRSIQRFKLRATKMAHGYSESSTVFLCLSEWLGGAEGPKSPDTQRHMHTPLHSSIDVKGKEEWMSELNVPVWTLSSASCDMNSECLEFPGSDTSVYHQSKYSHVQSNKEVPSNHCGFLNKTDILCFYMHSQLELHQS